jgi:two-component system, cell cycle response regulator DivK
MRRILLVEDNPANQLLASAVLQRDGFEVDVADSALEALRAVARQQPDLILMDIQLPEMDGLALTRQLKADPATASIAVVALTAHAMVGDKEDAIAAGCAGYIAKPIDTRTLGEQVRGFLQAHAAEAGT